MTRVDDVTEYIPGFIISPFMSTFNNSSLEVVSFVVSFFLATNTVLFDCSFFELNLTIANVEALKIRITIRAAMIICFR